MPSGGMGTKSGQGVGSRRSALRDQSTMGGTGIELLKRFSELLCGCQGWHYFNLRGGVPAGGGVDFGSRGHTYIHTYRIRYQRHVWQQQHLTLNVIFCGTSLSMRVVVGGGGLYGPFDEITTLSMAGGDCGRGRAL